MLSKKYSAIFKKEKVEEYLKECETNYVTKAEFAARNNISDLTFNDWVLKYQRDKNGFCNVTNEIIKLDNTCAIQSENYLIRKVEDADNSYIKDQDFLRVHYNGAVIEFHEIYLERVMRIVNKW